MPSPHPASHVPVRAKTRWWWEALADFWLANPTATHQQAADFFGRHISTIQVMANTDAFKAMLANRRAEMRETLDLALQQKVSGVAISALDALTAKLEKKQDTLPISDLTRVLETVQKFTPQAKGAPQVVVNNNNNTLIPVPVGVDDLMEAQRALRAHQSSLASPSPSLEVLEGSFSEVEQEKKDDEGP